MKFTLNNLLPILALFVVIFGNTQARADLPAWLEITTRTTWIYAGRISFDQAAAACQRRGGRLPSFSEFNTALHSGLSSDRPNRGWIVTPQNKNVLQTEHGLAWVSDPGVRPGIALAVYTYGGAMGREEQMSAANQFHVACILGGNVLPPPPVALDRCSEMTPHGISPCFNRTGCAWSNDSHQCYTQKGYQCEYYTPHGISACFNSSNQCAWSNDSRSCYHK